jgi:hypothetical protein
MPAGKKMWFLILCHATFYKFDYLSTINSVHSFEGFLGEGDKNPQLKSCLTNSGKS